MFILKIGKILSINFEQVYALQNNMVLSVAEVLSTYEYKVGLVQGMQYSYSTTIGLFKGVVGLIMLTIGNIVVKRISRGEEGI
jgi:putative aldouronate transport system permease protein